MKLLKRTNRALDFKKIIIGFAIIGFVTAPMYFIPKVLMVKKISCQSQYGPCNQLVTERFRNVEGTNLGDAKRSLSKQLSKNTLVKDFSLQFQFPSKLKVDIVERKARFALASPESSKYALIDKNGKVIAFENFSALPILIFSGKLPEIGEEVSQQSLFALEIVYDMFTSHKISKGTIEGESLVFEFLNGLTATFPLEGERELLVGSLNAIVTQLKSEGEDSRIDVSKSCERGCTIDLRFKNPVIK